MKLKVIKIDGASAGSVELVDDIFGLDPRVDILHRVVRWQRNKAQAGTHKVKTRSETSYSRKKIYRQKGTGGARHGDRNAPIFRKGGVYKGPTPRSHAHDLPKKVRTLGLKHALSAKAKEGALVIIDKATASGKTAELLEENTDKLVSGLVGALSLYPSENLTDPLAAKINEIKSEQLEKEGEGGEEQGSKGGSKKKNYRKTRKIRKKK